VAAPLHSWMPGQRASGCWMATAGAEVPGRPGVTRQAANEILDHLPETPDLVKAVAPLSHRSLTACKMIGQPPHHQF